MKMIGLWQKKVLPWVQRTGESWLPPESLGLLIEGDRVALTNEQLSDVKQRLEQALTNGGDNVDIGGHTVKATDDVLDAVNTLIHESQKKEGDSSDGVSKEPKSSQRNVLLIHDNLDGIDYEVSRRSHRASAPEVPALLKTQLKRHQKDGLRWLQDHWIRGSPGSLLADDMGLGKTLQVLAFLAWIREEIAAGMTPRKPILIVAPIGLLRNWEAEHALHMLKPGLGDLLTVYGQGVRRLRKSSQGELESGHSVLDREQLIRADWILTSYETLRDYQISFGLIPFSIAVFDEAQKIKTPGTLTTEAAKAINADFTVTMTGTPVENRLADLWCIADTSHPGILGDLKTFSQQYEREVTAGTLQVLKEKIWQSNIPDSKPALMLRRMKEDSLDALPNKHSHSLVRSMPTVQAEAYSQVVREALGAKDTMILEVLHRLRSISLHPFINQESSACSDDAYINASARLAASIEILDSIHKKGEKALIFLESLDMQNSRELPLILKNRYKLETLPLVINGTVAAPERQKRVERFQAGVGFDVMILSPRAGGVGLILTAANHVIHLSRWWNPAVEDQSTDRVTALGRTGMCMCITHFCSS
ncbi:MAG: DEAD/DEAH box helicase [Rhodocyclaceae bacterium]|nr:DEAD/DEAH box helicase [Rhodocyclaceae bacterium]